MARLTVFVTGAGALVGQGVLRALKMCQRPVRIVTGDPDHRASGHWLSDVGYRIPLAKDPDFVGRVEEVVRRERVDIVLVGTDVELSALSEARASFEERLPVRVVVSSPRVIEIADDKWKTMEFLRDHGLPYPRSALSRDPDAVHELACDVGFPLFAKLRRGARAQGVCVIHTRDQVEAICRAPSEYIVQELLSDNDGEYTAGCLVSDGRCHSVTVLRRDLRDGNTYRAYSEGATGFEPCLQRIAEQLAPDGPCNMQFRIRDGEPVIFEINARFSGTTPIRAIFGYNEVEILIDHLVNGKPIPPANLRDGIVLRTWSDVLIDSNEMQRFADEGQLRDPQAQAFPFKPLGDEQ